MILESLLELVETLKARIDTHGDELRQSEALTRYALIDPLLRELGWDTEDPALLIPEYKSGSGSADYALLTGNRPAMMVEAKKLGTPLQDSVVSQGIQYCLMEGTRYFSVTDGQRWELYETHKPVPIGEKRIIGFDLRGESAAEVCLNALALWRPSVQSGYAAPGQTPVVSLAHNQSGPPAASITDIHPTLRGSDEHDWQQLTQVSATKGQKPIEILFPDGNSTQLRNWGAAPVEVVRWLTAQKILSANDCPIMYSNPRTFRYMVHVQPIHSNGAPFTSPTEVNGLFVERHDNKSALIDKTKAIIQLVGQDPAQFSIRFS